MPSTEWPSHAAFDDTFFEDELVQTLGPSLGYIDERIVVRDGSAELLTTHAAPECCDLRI